MHYDFLGYRLAVVHQTYPFHRVGGFEGFGGSRFSGKAGHEVVQHIPRRPVCFRKVGV